MRRLPLEVKTLLTKAREAAILAVETYNRPTATFRTGAFVVLMVVAWTSLFHATFIRQRKKPFHRKKNSRRFEKVDGDYKAWELAECVRQYYGTDNPPERNNLLFFIGLRNKIEHRTLPQLDPEIFGECQSLLMNFEELLCNEFGRGYALKTGLTFALQFSSALHTIQSKAMAKHTQRHYKSVKTYVDSFRSALSDDIGKDLRYSFRVFLVPKVNNHVKSSDVAVEFVKYDPTRPEEMKKYEHLVTFIKEKQIPVANLGYFKAGNVIQQVSKRMDIKFGHYEHRLCYSHFHVRPPNRASDPVSTDVRYCIYDDVHKDYVYKPEWVDFLTGKVADSDFLEKLRALARNPSFSSNGKLSS